MGIKQRIRIKWQDRGHSGNYIIIVPDRDIIDLVEMETYRVFSVKKDVFTNGVHYRWDLNKLKKILIENWEECTFSNDPRGGVALCYRPMKYDVIPIVRDNPKANEIIRQFHESITHEIADNKPPAKKGHKGISKRERNVAKLKEILI